MHIENKFILEESFIRLKKFIEAENYKGYDPFDGLSGKFNSTFLFKYNLPRLVIQQLIKRSPINLRGILGIKKQHIPKGLGLLLSGYCAHYRLTGSEDSYQRCYELFELLIGMKTPGYSGNCWGFPGYWQTRAFFQPYGAPQIVASTYIGCALLDLYEISKDEKVLNEAIGIIPFILNDLNNIEQEDGAISVSYTCFDQSAVYNATALASRFAARVYSFTRDKSLLDFSKRTMAYVESGQNEDGSWPYSPLPFHQWVDGFHSGYNLECMAQYQEYTGDCSFSKILEKGFDYYMNTFFTDTGIPRYYNNSTYPIDVHSPAQLIITLSKMNRFSENKHVALKVLHWTIDNMQSRKGSFYYQINRIFTSKISYIRWSQAWMFYALSVCLLELKNENSD